MNLHQAPAMLHLPSVVAFEGHQTHQTQPSAAPQARRTLQSHPQSRQVSQPHPCGVGLRPAQAAALDPFCSRPRLQTQAVRTGP